MLSPKLQIEDVHNTLVEGLRKFVHSCGATRVCLGLSGGIDSAVVAFFKSKPKTFLNLIAKLFVSL